jgi:signal transduction histidine kinase
MNQKLVGADLSTITDKKGSYFFMQFCDAAEKNPVKGSWVEYWWPKPNENEASRKLSYVLKVPGTDYEVAAGIYSDKDSAGDLNAKLK